MPFSCSSLALTAEVVNANLPVIQLQKTYLSPTNLKDSRLTHSIAESIEYVFNEAPSYHCRWHKQHKCQ